MAGDTQGKGEVELSARAGNALGEGAGTPVELSGRAGEMVGPAATAECSQHGKM